MTIEREVKLDADVDFVVPALDVPKLSVVRRPTRSLHATYWDTDDLRLARWGVTLRHRTGDGQSRWTLKLPVDAEAAGLARDEIERSGPPDAVPHELSALVAAYVRGETIAAVVRLTTTRHRFDVVNRSGELVAEIDDDFVVAEDGAGDVSQFREIEVEAGPAATDRALKAIVKTLQAAGAQEAAQLPKLVRAIGPRALEPADVVVPDLDKEATAGDVVRAAVASSVARLIHHDPVVRLGLDPEGVHQARVATRRLRSDLRTFRSLVDRTWAEGLRAELKWIADRLGRVRDADVLLERFDRQIVDLGKDDGDAARVLVAGLVTERDTGRAALLEALDSGRYVELLDRLVAAAAGPVLTADASRPARAATADAVRRPWRRLRAAADAITPETEDAHRHEVRIRAKRVRYAAEAAAPVWGKKAARFAKAVARVQTVLGDLQDSVIAEEWLRRAAVSPDTAFAAGLLTARQIQDAEAARRAFADEWAVASHPDLRGWFTTG